MSAKKVIIPGAWLRRFAPGRGDGAYIDGVRHEGDSLFIYVKNSFTWFEFKNPCQAQNGKGQSIDYVTAEIDEIPEALENIIKWQTS